MDTPNRASFRIESLAWAVALSMFFVVVYGGCTAITAMRSHVPTYAFAWEMHLPFVSAFVIPYMSIDAFFVAAPFVCVTRQELRGHGKRVLLAIAAAGLCFLLYPLQTAFTRPAVSGWSAPMLRVFWTMDRTANLAPSLHIALRGLLWAIYCRHTKGLARTALQIWFIFIGASTVLTYQHQVIDIVTGYVLAALCLAIFPQPTEPGGLAETEPSGLAAGHVTRRTIRIAAVYAIIAGALAVTAWFMHPHAIWLLWPIFAFAALAAAYGGLGPRVFGKSHGRVPMLQRLLFPPYLVLAFITRWPYRRWSHHWDEVGPGILVGGQLTAAAARKLIAEYGPLAVLDLTAGAPEPRVLVEQHYLNIPLLDSTAPTPNQMTAALRFIRERRPHGVVFIHCALGYSRSVGVATAALVDNSLADNLEAAIARVRAARPGARFNADSLSALQSVSPSVKC